MRLGFGLLLLIFSLLAVNASAQTTPQSPVPLPVPFNPIVDNANVIDADTRQRLEAIYLNLKERGQIEYSVVTVDTTGDRDIFDYSLAIARGWGIGPKDGDKASFLLVVAIQDRKYFTQVSRHIEGDLPDGLVGTIQRERLVPPFRQGNYSKGIYDTVQAYVATIAAKRGFSVDGIDQRYAYEGGDGNITATQDRTNRVSLRTVCCGIVLVVFVVILIAGASRGGPGGRGGRRRRGFGGGGLLEALLWGSVLGNLSGGGSSSGWGSSGGFGGGGFGGGGGGGFGGGFGGGDSFGGGGAGSSW